MFRGQKIKLTLNQRFELIRNTFSGLFQDNVFTHGAAIAYYALLSMAPLLYFGVNFLGYLLGKKKIIEVVEVLLSENTGINDISAITALIDQIDFDNQSTSMHFIGIIILMFSCSAIFNAVKVSINNFYRVKNEGVARKKIILGNIFSRLISLLFVVGITILLVVIYFLESILFGVLSHWLSSMSYVSSFLGSVINHGLSILGNVLIFTFVFKYLNNAIVPWRFAFKGAVTTSVLLFFGQLLIKEYITNHFFAANIGASGSILMILVWVYYSSLLVFFGAKYIYELALITGEPIKRR